jgi:Protein of unknown function (DUF2585)
MQPGARRATAYLRPALMILAVLAVHILLLRWEGRRWWCACGRPDLWWGDTRSAHNSQHLFDPYSFTHVLHGVLLCGLLSRFARRLSPAWRFCLAVALEAVWEVIENSDPVIGRYRTATGALGYYGDTVANSLGDILSCVVGYLLARRLGPWWSLALFVAIEVVLLVWIRDSLLLEVLMLFCPIDAIKRWQVGS